MSGIYQKQINSGSVASPGAGSTLISVNESGELFTKDSSGDVTVYGGGGTPSGADTEIQYNDSGAFGSDSGFTRTSEGFFAMQNQVAALDPGTLLGTGDATQGGGPPVFANAALYFDDDVDVQILSGDLTNLTGFKGALIAVTEGDDNGYVFTTSEGSGMAYEGLNETATIAALQDGAGIKYEGATLTTEFLIGDNGIEISYNGNSAYTLPLTDGTAGQVLSTDGAGTLSWITP